jgi:hypothetical protein
MEIIVAVHEPHPCTTQKIRSMGCYLKLDPWGAWTTWWAPTNDCPIRVISYTDFHSSENKLWTYIYISIGVFQSI